MLTVTADLKTRTLAGAHPEVKAYISKITTSLPTLISAPTITNGRAKDAVVTATAMIRVRKHTNYNIEADQTLLTGLLTENWNTYTKLVAGGGSAGTIYAIFKKGADIVILWATPTADNLIWRVYSTDDGISWSTSSAILDVTGGGITKLAGLNEYGFVLTNTNTNQFQFYPWNTSTHTIGSVENFTPTSGTCVEAAGTQDTGTLRLVTTTEYASQRLFESWVKVAGVWTATLLMSGATINDLYIAYADQYYLSFQKDGIDYVYSSLDLSTMRLEITGLSAPIFYYGLSYLWSCNGERYTKNTSSSLADGTLLPTVVSYKFDKDELEIEFLETPTIQTTDFVHVKRGPSTGATDESNLVRTPPYAFKSLNGKIFHGKPLPPFTLSGIPSAVRLTALLNNMAQQAGIPDFSYSTDFTNYIFSPSNAKTFENIDLQTAIDSITNEYALIFCPRASGHKFIRPTDPGATQFVVTAIETELHYKSTPGYVILTYTNENNLTTQTTITIDTAISLIQYHKLTHKDTGDSTLPSLAAFYKNIQSGLTIATCRPHLEAEIGDWVSLSGEKLLLNIQESFKTGKHPSWQQILTLASL